MEDESVSEVSIGAEMNERGAGRFAPSPSGRMHLGNVFTALLSWLSARAAGRRWVLRIEDLDPQRSKIEFARQIEDDLAWLGLNWDEGGLDGAGSHGSYCQSRRGEIYARHLEILARRGVLYPCSCRRADIMATQAPHQSDGRVVYRGTCRPAPAPPFHSVVADGRTLRLYVPDEDIFFTDGLYGSQRSNLAEDCGDFVVRRADGAWAYQLAVVADDALMGVTEVVRGSDLLLSTAQQLYLYRLFGYEAPHYVHVPLLCNSEGRRLSKRDCGAGMAELRSRYTPGQITGLLAYMAGLIPRPESVSPRELVPEFSWERVPYSPTLTVPPAIS